MVDTFHTRIRASLADANLQAALDANAERRILVRRKAFESLADPQSLRQRAHLIRAEVIEHLDEYLQQFIEAAERNGMRIHPARDAAQANQIVLEIAQQKNARLIAKSKTMVSEEIGLNHALEAQGLQVIETDLGEYIVQLRGETPSHIITPAVHLRRQDVARLFEEKLGMPYTEEIPVMTNLARQTLREVFLNADIGISGVNFAVAESGTLCVVTNEGNGRMVTTLPRTHIALMGIERILPTMNDLALLLSLLPRSATGQKLSVYTSLLNSPRQGDDPDGPQERHVILVDNGRRRVRDSALKEILYCIRCGACLNACPVFREIGGHAYVGKHGQGSAYPGPIGSVISPALFGGEEFGQLARASTLCGACREACPVDIDLPKLLLRVRAGMGPDAPKGRPKPNPPKFLSFGLGMYTLAASSPGRFSMAQRLAGWLGDLNDVFASRKHWIKLPSFTGWGVSKDFPRPARRSFHQQFSGGQVRRATRLQGSSSPTIRSDEKAAASVEAVIPAQGGWERFARELSLVGGEFHLLPVEEIAQQVKEILSSHGMDQALVWDEARLPPGLPADLQLLGIRLYQPDGEHLQAASPIKAGLTGALKAIADTGSLLLAGGDGQPLTASLLPEIHIAILREGDIVQSLGEVIESEEIKTASAALIITGPSRTADIEMTLTIGVHGPGELHVLCIKNR